jgi:SAM-dependent methyltransferase
MSSDGAQTGPSLFPEVAQLARGFWLSQALYAAAKLAVFDALRERPRAVQEIAQICGAHEPSLHRLLRFLTAVDVLCEDDAGRFACTPRGALLRADHPQSIRPQMLMYGDPFYWRAFGQLYEAVKSGRPGFEHAHGEPFFDYLARHADAAAVFDAAMTGFSRIDLPTVLEAYDFSEFATIVDVGGGQGALLRGILARCPRAVGVLCDRRAVLDAARALPPDGTAARIELVEVDMFQSVPPGGDAYLLKRILHDWNDADAVRILTSVRRALAAGGKVLVMDAVVGAPNQPDPAKWMDINMLAVLHGRERTAEEFGALYAAAGLRLTRIVPAMALSIIEGVAA